MDFEPPKYSRADLRQKARQWGAASPWMAEAYIFSVSYLKTPKGKQLFEDWLRLKYGPTKSAEVIAECNSPPRRGTSTGAQNLSVAAHDLGVSIRFLVEATNYASTQKSPECWPPRTTPAPIRKKGESSGVWLSRREEALLQGAKIPDAQWAELRRIAVSEFEHIRDQMEMWRTQPVTFFRELEERSDSTILTPPVPTEIPLRFRQACMDAFRSRLNIAHLQYAAWSQAVELFEEFDRRGLKTSASITEAYKSDNKLHAQIVSVALWTKELSRWYDGKMKQIITASKYLQPMFTRRRLEDGSAEVLFNETRRKPREGSLEWLLSIFYSSKPYNMSVTSFLKELRKVLGRPGEAEKLTAEAYNAIGDFSVSYEFAEAFSVTPFGLELLKATRDADARGVTRSWFPTLSAISESKLVRVPLEPFFEEFGSCNNVVKSHQDVWLGQVFLLDLQPSLDVLIRTEDYDLAFDVIWYYTDAPLWEAAKELDREPGAIAKLYGLVDPEDPNRPLHSDKVLRDLKKKDDKAEAERIRREDASKPVAYESNIPTATPQDSAPKAPERTEEAPKRVRPKKNKGRPIPKNPPSEPKPPSSPGLDVDIFVEENTHLPESLPSDWKLTRKNADLFHRLFGKEVKGGQVRWGDFENAMAQLGFDIVQTEGSSVRFDPPARKTRSITFHRPHPESTMTPILMKWVGARLKRAYGWSAETFAVRQAAN